MAAGTAAILWTEDALALRRMRDVPEDYALLARWLTDERVLFYYEGRDNPFPLERTLTEYRPRVLGEEMVTPCILLLQGTAIGYLQHYPLNEEERHLYDLLDIDGCYGMDLFIGEPLLWDRGIGARVVSATLRWLFREQGAARVLIDPEAWNTRAIRCYEKCGFVKVKLLPRHELHEGAYRDCWLMACDRPPAAANAPASVCRTTDNQPILPSSP